VRRRDLYREVDSILCDEAPWAFAYAAHRFYVRQPYVRALVPHPVWSLEATRTWIDKASVGLDRVLRGALR
jgi:hypothetical protein